MQSETHSPQLEVFRLSAAGLVSESDESSLPYGDSPWLEVFRLSAAGSFNILMAKFNHCQGVVINEVIFSLVSKNSGILKWFGGTYSVLNN